LPLRLLSYLCVSPEEFKEFCDYIDFVVEAAISRNMPNAGQQLLNAMRDDVWQFRSIISLPDSQDLSYSDVQVPDYSQIAIFKYIQPNNFVEALLQLKCRDQRTVRIALKERYRYDDINKKLIEEYEWLTSVRSLLKDEVSRRINKLSGYRLKLIIEDCLDVVIKKLEKFH
jgi:hypothetical protein